jgi:integrase
LEALPVPETGRVYHYDEMAPGLALCVTAAGTRTFYLYRKVNRRPIRVKIGGFPELTVKQARDLASKLNVAIAAGHDPQEAKQARRREATFGELFQHWLEIHAKPYLKTWSEWDGIRNRYLSEWENRRLSAIKKTDVQALHARLGDKNGHYAANRTLSLIKMVFNKADGIGWKGENPARGVRRFPEESRDRFLAPEELPRFFQALIGEPSPLLQGFFLICLLSGARRGNVQRMRWEDIDFAGARWRIPETKSGHVVVVPLVPLAVETLRTLQELNDGSEWVFPAVRQGKRGLPFLADPMPAWRRLCKRAGLANLRIHDLRRSLGSWQALTGASLQIIGKSLGHTRPETTQIYSRLTLDPVRESVEKATEAIRVAAGGRLPRIGENGGQDNDETQD